MSKISFISSLCLLAGNAVADESADGGVLRGSGADYESGSYEFKDGYKEKPDQDYTKVLHYQNPPGTQGMIWLTTHDDLSFQNKTFSAPFDGGAADEPCKALMNMTNFDKTGIFSINFNWNLPKNEGWPGDDSPTLYGQLTNNKNSTSSDHYTIQWYQNCKNGKLLGEVVNHTWTGYYRD